MKNNWNFDDTGTILFYNIGLDSIFEVTSTLGFLTSYGLVSFNSPHYIYLGEL